MKTSSDHEVEAVQFTSKTTLLPMPGGGGNSEMKKFLFR